MRTSPNAAAIDTKKKKKNSLSLKASHMQGSPVLCPHLHCKPLNEVWEEVYPGSTPSSCSGALHAAELPWVGPAFPPGAPSLVQPVT